MSKSRLRSLLSASLLCIGMNSPVGAAEPGMYLYNWFGFIAPQTPKEFEQETGTRFHMDAFDSAEIMQSKVMAGRTGYDVVVATSNVLPSLIQAGVLQPLFRLVANRRRPGRWQYLRGRGLGQWCSCGAVHEREEQHGTQDCL